MRLTLSHGRTPAQTDYTSGAGRLVGQNDWSTTTRVHHRRRRALPPAPDAGPAEVVNLSTSVRMAAVLAQASSRGVRTRCATSIISDRLQAAYRLRAGLPARGQAGMARISS